MRKGISLGLMVLLGLGLMGIALAQTQATQKPAPKKPLLHQFAGTVDSVTQADPSKGTKSEIVVVDKNKKSMTFLILSTTTIYDAKGGAITLDKLAKGDEVIVRYRISTEGVNEAVTVRKQK
jgi:hypothetical protein